MPLFLKWSEAVAQVSLADVLKAARCKPGLLSTDVPVGWMQGRTAYGGFSTALAYEAARSLTDAMRPLRGVQVAFIAPVTGRVEARAHIERQGRNAVWVRSELRSADQLVLSARFVFMAPIASTASFSGMAVPQGIAPLAMAEPMAENEGPAFLNNFEIRHALPPVRGVTTGDGTTSNEATGGAANGGSVSRWMRLKGDVAALDPFTHILTMADSLPPAARSLISPGAPVSSMVWQTGFLHTKPATHDGWWLLRSAADHARDGCSTQSMQLWNSDGVAMASGSAVIALFG